MDALEFMNKLNNHLKNYQNLSELTIMDTSGRGLKEIRYHENFIILDFIQRALPLEVLNIKSRGVTTFELYNNLPEDNTIVYCTDSEDYYIFIKKDTTYIKISEDLVIAMIERSTVNEIENLEDK